LSPVPPIGGPPIAFAVAAGHQYALQLSSGFVPVGRFALDARFVDLANDMFTNSLQIEGTNVPLVWADNRLATLEADEGVPLPGAAGRTLWYSWAAPFMGRVTISSGSAYSGYFDRALAVYTGPDLDHLQLLTSGRRIVFFMSEEGMVYHLQADGFGGAGEFNISLQADAFQPAPNDNFNDSITIEGGIAYGGGVWINNATLEPGEPAHRDGAACKSLWWTWQVPVNGRASIGYNGGLATNFSVAVYTGSTVSTLRLLAKGNTVRPLVTGGTILHIAVVADEPTIGDVFFYAYNIEEGPSVTIPGNLLREPSFEGTGLSLAHWHLPFGFNFGYVGEPGGADGATWLSLGAGKNIWQEFVTIPGRKYEVRFAFRPDWGGTHRISVRWDDVELGTASVAGQYWHWTNLITTASNTTSRLTFEVLEGILSLDAFSVVPADVPPVIITQPSSASTFAGGAANFVVGVSGSTPLAYQWYFNQERLDGQTAHTLSLYPVSQSHAGDYFAIVTNVYGAVTSAPATLVVEAPTSPTIVLQPYGDAVAAGNYFAFSVAVVGTPPLHYQWFFNGDGIQDATNRQFILASVQTTNAGTYSVKVWNGAEAVWSLPAALTIETNWTGGGAFWFGNEIPDGRYVRKAPVFDVDGITKLNGSGFVAQLYAGPSLALIRAVGQPRTFRTGFNAGLISPEAVVLPTVAPNTMAFVQVRVWQTSKGATYEEARALGSKFGKSEILQIFPGIMPNPPPLWGLQSFALQAGLPQFVVGRIEFAERREDGTIVWALQGEAGYRYVIEKTVEDTVWRPLLVLTNVTGTATFTDPSPVAGDRSFYRARILE
jgi:hypothetical protein